MKLRCMNYGFYMSTLNEITMYVLRCMSYDVYTYALNEITMYELQCLCVCVN